MLDSENWFINGAMLSARTEEQYKRAVHDMQMLRGPMMEADIDWRAPQEYRSMVEGDL